MATAVGYGQIRQALNKALFSFPQAKIFYLHYHLDTSFKSKRQYLGNLLLNEAGKRKSGVPDLPAPF
jgi:hypothetical protein